MRRLQTKSRSLPSRELIHPTVRRQIRPQFGDPRATEGYASSVQPTSGPPPQHAEAIDFAFQVASDQLSSQLATASEVDTKLGVVIAALASIAALYSATGAIKVAALAFLIPAVIAFIGYRAREWQNPPEPDALINKYLNDGKSEMQLQAIAVILEAYASNQTQLSRKAQIFNWSLLATFGAVGFVLLLSVVVPTAR
jgi:hypothetical protein